MGGKSKLAATIIDHLPDHTTYVEPFCGGCAVFFRKPRSKAEILNDADNRLITLLRVMRYHPDELLREVGFLTHSRQEFRDALQQPGVTDIQRAARFLFIVKAAFGSRLSSPTFGVNKDSKANFNRTSITSLLDAARERLDGVTIENLDFEEAIRRYDSSSTLFYCDPPYIGTAGYACKFTMDDHRRLRAALADVKGRALVSLNDCEVARKLYGDWQMKTLAVTYSVGLDADRKKKNAEALFVNNKFFDIGHKKRLNL